MSFPAAGEASPCLLLDKGARVCRPSHPTPENAPARPLRPPSERPPACECAEGGLAQDSERGRSGTGSEWGSDCPGARVAGKMGISPGAGRKGGWNPHRDVSALGPARPSAASRAVRKPGKQGENQPRWGIAGLQPGDLSRGGGGGANGGVGGGAGVAGKGRRGGGPVSGRRQNVTAARRAQTAPQPRRPQPKQNIAN